MKKTNGHNWKDFEVDTMIAIQKEKWMPNFLRVPIYNCN